MSCQSTIFAGHCQSGCRASPACLQCPMSPEKSIDMQTRMPLRSRGRSNKPPTGLPNLDPGGSSPGGGRSDTTWSRAGNRMQTNGWEGWECNGLQPQNGLQPTRDGPPIGGCGCVFLEVWLGRPVFLRPSGRSSSADLSSKTGVARAFHSRREGGFLNPQPSHHRPFPAFQGVPRSGWRDLDRLVNESTTRVL